MRRWRIAAALIAAALAGQVVSVMGQGADEEAGDGRRVFLPDEPSVLESGRLEVICAEPDDEAPRLSVDGEPVEWSETAPPIRLARLELAPGEHEVRVGESAHRLFVVADGGPEAPDGWPAWRSHSGTDDGWKDCALCHETEPGGGSVAVGRPTTPEGCDGCHTDEDFELTHFHPKGPIASCEMCHAIHGASEDRLLKGPIKKLCAACHE